MNSDTQINNSLGSLEFRDLPLIEVVARIVLKQELSDFSLGKILQLAKALEIKFPIVEDTAAIEMTGPASKLPKPGSLLGVSFVAVPPDVRITVQRNIVKWTWTRTIEEETKKMLEYPRYKRVREELGLAVDFVGKILSGQPLAVNSVNMGYTNFIAIKGKAANETSGRYLAQSINAEIMGSSPTVHEISLNWRTSKGLDRKLQFAAGKSGFGPEPVDGYVLATNVGGFMEARKDPMELLDEIHLDLQDFFLTIISDNAKKEWEYVERS
jgi:uncharacterized protein (TIGR04255 family)